MTVSSTKADPLGWIWNQARRLYRRMRGEKIERIVRPTVTQRDRYAAQELRTGNTDNLVADLWAEKIDLNQWVLGMRENVKTTFINQYILARGGRDAMTQADWGRLGAMIKKQYGFVDRFAGDLASGKMTEGQARVRAQMYTKAATQAYETGRAVTAGVPNLPAQPGDGQTVCLANCQCHWDIEETDDEFLCTWTLGASEHCPDCLDNADRWAPLRLPKVRR